MNILFPDYVRQAVLEVVTPLPEEIAVQQRIISELKNALKKRATDLSYDYAFIEAQGSTGEKQTQLRGAGDIDLFVALRVKDYSEILERPLHERDRQLSVAFDSIIDNWFRPAVSGLPVSNIVKTYSQHPFLSLKMFDMDVDILPCFDLTDREIAERGPITAVDRTIHHTRYVARRLTPRLREDIRLMKSFVRAAHAYGDKSAIGRTGFTGYALEILVLSNGGIEGALDTLQTLRERPVDPAGRTLAELRANPVFKTDYVFIIDPTDHGRNAGASFSPRACNWVIHRTAELLRCLREGRLDSAIDLCIERPIPTTPLPENVLRHAMSFEFESDETIHYTVLRDKLSSLANKIQNALERETTGPPRFGRVLTEVYFEDRRYSLGLLVERPEIESHYLRRGPPVRMRRAAEKFREEHTDAFECDGYLWISARRSWTSAWKMAHHIIQRNPIKGLTAVPPSEVSARVLNILYLYVNQIEPLQLS